MLSSRNTAWRSAQGIPTAKFVVVTLAALWLVQIPLLGSLLVLATFGVLASFGRALTTRSGFGELGHGVGLTIGAGCMVLLNQVLLAMQLPPYVSHWVVIAVLVICTIFFRYRQIENSTESHVVTPSEPLSIIALALLVFGMRHQWILPFAIGVCALERSQPVLQRRRLAHVGVLGLVAATVPLSAALRPDRWWYFYQGNDSQFFESMGWTASHWGVFEHPGYTGGSIANYHWLSYALVGDINHLAGTPPWDVFMKVGVLLTCAALAGVFLGLRQDMSKIASIQIWGLTGLAVIASSGVVYNSLAFSVPMAMSIFMLCGRFRTARKHLRIAVLVIAAVSLTFTKTSTAVVVVGVLTVVVLLGRPRPRIVDFYPLVIIGGTGVVLYLLLFRGASQLSALALDSPNPTEALRAIWLLLTSPKTVLQVFIWVACFSALRFKNLRGAFRAALPYIVLSVCATLAISLARTDALSGFVTPVFNFVTFFAVRAWHASQRDGSPTKAPFGLTKATILCALGFVIGVNSWPAITQIELRISDEEFFNSAFWEGVRQSAYLTTAVLLLIAILLTPQLRRLAWAITGCVMLTFGLAIGASRSAYTSAATLGPDPLQNWRGGNSAPFSDTDLRVVGRWIRKNTPSDAVLASNNFCCPGLEWWRAIVNNLDIYEQDPDARIAVPRFEPSFGGDNYLIPVETRRRFYMQGMGHQPIPLGGTISQDQINRMTLSLEFANEPSQRVVDQLKLAGVDGFVVNLALTQHRDWSDYAIEKFKNGNFAYLVLR